MINMQLTSIFKIYVTINILLYIYTVLKCEYIIYMIGIYWNNNEIKFTIFITAIYCQNIRNHMS